MTYYNRRFRLDLMLWLGVFWLFSLAWVTPAAAVELGKYPKLVAVADQLVAEQYYTRGHLEELFAQAELQQSILEAMQNPAEYKFTWGKYRKLFMQTDRIQQGVDFWRQYAAPLARAEQQYGVPASVIVAIIGVESKFGKYKGKHKVLDSLTTLVVGFERRSEFFADELRQFLILTRENNLAATEILGSYAGAVGFPQFISSSYRAYAVDFSGDGSIDLINQPVDAIGSVANYFMKNGWLSGQPVSSAAHTSVSAALAELANRKRQVQHSAKSLRGLGAPLASEINDTEKLSVLMLDASETVADPSKPRFYVVRAGDTACQIAERHKVSCRALFKRNKLNKKGVIYRDQRLEIPTTATLSIGPAPDKAKSGSGKWQLKNKPASQAGTRTGAGSMTEPRYFFTHENFYVITRYNQSVLYAMAVHHLSQAIVTANELYAQSNQDSQ